MCHTIDMYVHVFWHFLWCTNPQIINVEVVKKMLKKKREREGERERERERDKRDRGMIYTCSLILTYG